MTYRMGKTRNIVLVGIACGAIGAYGYHTYQKHRRKGAHPLNVIKYVFFDPYGKILTLMDREICDIKQKYEDGVLLSAIAEDLNIDVIMITRIINLTKADGLTGVASSANTKNL